MDCLHVFNSTNPETLQNKVFCEIILFFCRRRRQNLRELKMKKVSIEAKLSCVYTNHSIRATTITILDECGYEARHIMALSGHRSESSIQSYAYQTSLSTKRKMSETLSESLNNKKTVTTIAATSSVGHSEIPVAVRCNHFSQPLRKSIF